MKRKNTLKFISLLGISSFVMLTASSCTQAITLIPNSSSSTINSRSNSNSNTASKDVNTTNSASSSNTNSSSGVRTNNPSSGRSTTNNPSNGSVAPNPAAQELAAARKTLTDLIGTESTNVALYSNYSNILSALKSAYQTAKFASRNPNATLDQVRSLTTNLQKAIDKAASDKQAFDNAKRSLVTVFNELKVTLQSKTTTLNGLSDNKYSRIRDSVNQVFNKGSEITSKPLNSFMGTPSEVENITKINQDIKDLLTKVPGWKQNVDAFNNFEQKTLSRTQLTETNSTNSQQPSNWSFAGYNVDLTTGSTGLQNLNFAQRKVWTRNNNTTSPVSNPVSSPDVSWIYSLTGTNTKYTLKFNYYGASTTAYLYFPYKLVKNNDQVALQYKLNDARQATAITFGTQTNANGPTPTVGDINVAKITLSNLKFGENTVEFSVPTSNPAKVAPMIGNMYLTSNVNSQQNIYNQIFGNTNSNQTSVLVDLLKGYSLTSGWSTYFGEFKNLAIPSETPANLRPTNASYLVGLIARTNERGLAGTVNNPVKSPMATGQNRTYTIFVNAPSAGQYYISGSYISTLGQSLLKFQTEGTSNSLTVSVTSRTSLTTLEAFDTRRTDVARSRVVDNGHRTLTLKQGINKIVISGDGTNETPFIGKLIFSK
ncbi:FIVAR domain-containing protein [Mycoplasma tullyi]|uniref:FIVAR domain-containing protein n=1 Tax=Mycoplasma tullyi TaxID=1612150 RepID=A0A7D7XW34_9MOLU|nr:FIVAR domain-containing protein [Mycoplasma tullyi]QMT98273.1 FIVAR domain-containing protein [Mycoplasma tullyi]